MKMSKLAIVVAVFVAGSVAPAIAQGPPVSNLRQPTGVNPAVTPLPAAATTPVVSAPSIQQPRDFTTAWAPETTTFGEPTVPVGTEKVAAPQVAVAAPTAVPVPVTVPAAAVVVPPIQQPSVMIPAEPKPTAATTSPSIWQPMSEIQQPEAFWAAGVAPQPISTALMQPEALSPATSLFASYYDEEEDEEGDDEDYSYDDEDEEDGECGDDVGCGDEAECDETCFCGFEVGGWVEQGYTFNPYNPRDGYNGTVILNDFANQWQLNQLWLYANRDVDNGGSGWDWGGRFDILFGTDAELFQMADGLEESWGQDGDYQVAMLRFYLDVAYNDWTLRGGRWDSPVGYEPYDATESFFYSRTYNFYAAPGSLLGLLLTRHLNDQFSLSAGIHRGSDQFDDTDGKDSVNFVGGGSWNSVDEETWLDIYMLAEEEGIGNDRFDYCVTGGTMLTDKLEYVIEWYYGQTDDFTNQAQWYGLAHYFMKEIDECWSHGVRFEWFRDDDGYILVGTREANPAGPFNGNFFDLTYAINYQPCENFVLRPEVRWDWYDASAGGPLPFDDGNRTDQFLVSIDAIWAF